MSNINNPIRIHYNPIKMHYNPMKIHYNPIYNSIADQRRKSAKQFFMMSFIILRMIISLLKNRREAGFYSGFFYARLSYFIFSKLIL